MTDSDAKERLRDQADEQTRQKSAQQGLAANQKQVSERKFNPSFLRRLQEADIDSQTHDFLTEEFPALFSGAQLIGQRGEEYEQQQEFLNRSKAERVIAEQSAGALLKRHDGVAAMMEDDSTISSDQKRVTRTAMEVATARQGLSVGARGLRSVTTATSETRTVRHEDDDSGSVIGTASNKVFG